MFKIIFAPIKWIFSLFAKFLKLRLWLQMFILSLLAITSIVLMSTSFGHKADYMTVATSDGYMQVGVSAIESDTIDIAAGDSLRLLAREDKKIWAETPDGKFRGFIPPSIVGETDGLPSRYKNEAYIMSFRKFRSIMADSAFTIAKLYELGEADFTKVCGDTITIVSDIFVFDDIANLYSLTFKFNRDSTLKELRYYPARGQRSATPALKDDDTHIAKFVDFFAPVISPPEFPAISPSNWLLSVTFQYLGAYLPLCILMLLLAWRLPLYFVPNWIVNLLIIICLTVAPRIWVGIMVLRGFPPLLLYPLIFIISIALALFFLGVYRELRCPRCKRLEYHEVISTELLSREYTDRDRELDGETRHTGTTTGYEVTHGETITTKKIWEERHYETEVIKRTEHVEKEKIKEFTRCRHCGHERTIIRRKNTVIGWTNKGRGVRKESKRRYER